MSSDAEIQAAVEQVREWVEKYGAEPVFIYTHASDCKPRRDWMYYAVMGFGALGVAIGVTWLVAWFVTLFA